MKILLVSAAYPPYISGVSTATANLVNFLAKNHKVSVIAGGTVHTPRQKTINPNLNLFLFPGIEIRRQKIGLTIPYPYPKEALALIKQERPDIIHLQDFSPISFSVLATASRLKIPVIVTHHFTAEFVYKTLITGQKFSSTLSNNRLAQQLVYRLVNFFYNRCDLVSVPNANLIPYFKKAGLKKPIVAIPNGIVVKNFRRRARLKYVLNKYHIKQPQIILFTGRLEPDKNIGDLISAFAAVRQYNPAASLVIVGDGNKKRQLIGQTKKLGISTAVYFLNKIDNSDSGLSHLYNAATVFASASIIENQSVAFIEAMAAGLPIVSAATPINNDLSFKGLEFEGGNVKALAVALDKILTDHKLRKTISKYNRRLSNQYDISITSRQYLQAYQALKA